MDDLYSPKDIVQLAKSVEEAIWKEFEFHKQQVYLYIDKWHNVNHNSFLREENFSIVKGEDNEIDLTLTLHGMDSRDLIQIAIDLGVGIPDFIPSIPAFKNIIKFEYKTAYDTFTSAYKQIETDPSLAVGLANSALESIIKEILKDERIASKTTNNDTLYKLTLTILKEFNITDTRHPEEIKTIGDSLLTINKMIERLRSKKTNFHGKTDEDYLITDPIYTHFIINTVTTVGLFLISYYKTKFPIIKKDDDYELPF